jgi:hypothetical protein
MEGVVVPHVMLTRRVMVVHASKLIATMTRPEIEKRRRVFIGMYTRCLTIKSTPWNLTDPEIVRRMNVVE